VATTFEFFVILQAVPFIAALVGSVLAVRLRRSLGGRASWCAAAGFGLVALGEFRTGLLVFGDIGLMVWSTPLLLADLLSMPLLVLSVVFADRAGPADIIPVVDGQVSEDHLPQLFDYLERHLGYQYDGGAVAAAMSTGADAVAPALRMRLGRSPDDAMMSVQVQGAMDPILAARIQTLLTVL
jgi:hypothetical protein